MYSGEHVVFTIISLIRGSNNNYISPFFAIPYHTTPIVGNVVSYLFKWKPDISRSRTSRQTHWSRSCRRICWYSVSLSFMQNHRLIRRHLSLVVLFLRIISFNQGNGGGINDKFYYGFYCGGPWGLWSSFI